MMTIIYIHGLSSSGESSTVKVLRALLPSIQVISPDLPTNPYEAMQLLKDLCDDMKPDMIVGTSMGGMFAQRLHGYKKILVNPAFHVSKFMRQNMGVQQFLNPRKDGAIHYEITEELCDEYQEFEASQFENIIVSDLKNTHAFFGKNDTLVNCYEEYCRHYVNAEWFDGEHRLRFEDVRDIIVPLISVELAYKKNTSTESFLKLIESICHQRDLAINEKNFNFNIFKVMGMQTDEVKLHSAFLAELLNPKGSHGMGDLFLIEFINKCSFIDKAFNTSKVDVEVEKYVGEIPESKETGGRLDIFITDKTQTIIIENKIYAPDQEKQLVRYHNYNFNACIIYLTLDGHVPMNDSVCHLEKSNHYHCISYKKDIVEWLEQCLTAAREKPLFYNTLLQYINTIKELTNQSLIPAMDNVLSAAIKNNMEASIEIEKAMPNIRNEFHRDFWKLVVNELGVQPLKAISDLPNWKNYDEIIRYEIEDKYKGEILIFRLRLSKDSGIYMGITTKNETICKDTKFEPIIRAFSNWESMNGSAHIVWKSIGLNFWMCDSRTISYMQSDEKERKSFISYLAIEINQIKEQLTDLCAKSSKQVQ